MFAHSSFFYLDGFDDLPERAKIEVEFEASSTYQLTLISESKDGGTLVQCELEAEDIHQLVAGIKHELDLHGPIRLFRVDDSGCDDEIDKEVLDLSSLGSDSTIRVVEESEDDDVEEKDPDPDPEPEPEPEAELEPKPKPVEEVDDASLPPPPSPPPKPSEPEPELEEDPQPPQPIYLDLPAPPPIDNGSICSNKFGQTEQKYDFAADFTVEWWQSVCFRSSPTDVFGEELAQLDCWPDLSLTPDNLAAIAKTNPGKLANNVNVRDFVALFGARSTCAQTVYRVFMAQHDCSSRTWDIVQLLTLCNPIKPIPDRLADSMQLYASSETGGDCACIDKAVMSKWMGGVKRISQAVLMRFLESTAIMCGTENGETIASEAFEKAIKGSLDCLSADLRTAKFPMKKSSTHTLPVAQFVTTASTRVLRLSDWLNGNEHR